MATATSCTISAGVDAAGVTGIGAGVDTDTVGMVGSVTTGGATVGTTEGTTVGRVTVGTTVGTVTAGVVDTVGAWDAASAAAYSLAHAWS
jgi:hypothetical protein